MEQNFSHPNSVFITGAAGFLGTQVTRLILEQRQDPIVVLVRGKDLSDARHRLERAWQDWPGVTGEIGNRVRIVNGDLCQPKMGLSEAVYEELIGSVSHIIHIAADIRLNEPLEALRRINVGGVGNILEFACSVNRRSGLERFSYV